MQASSDDPTTGQVAEEIAVIPVAEERLHVAVVAEDRIAARISRRTESEDVPVSQTLRKSRIEVERVPVDRIVADPPEARDEDGVTVIPVFEEILVRQYRVTEEVRVSHIDETVEHRETVTLRRRNVSVAATDDADR